MENFAVDSELVKKWKQVFIFLDVNGDGLLTKADFDMVQEALLKKQELSNEKKAEMKKLSYTIWVSALRNELQDKITSDEYINKWGRNFADGSMEKQTRDIRIKMFYCMDLNNDGFIDFDEFRIFADTIGRSDTPYLKRAFDAIDTDRNGRISLEEYLSAYVGYHCDPKVKLEDMPLYGLEE